jgi:hypothetical protein
MFKISSNFIPITSGLLYTKKIELNRAKKEITILIQEKERFYAKPIDRSYLNAIIKTNI